MVRKLQPVEISCLIITTSTLIEISISVKELHHHIALTGSPRADIKWWKDLLSRWKAVSLALHDDGSKQLT